MSETATGTAPRWLVCRARRPQAPLRLYCFPHSGGSAGEFVRWSDSLPDTEVLGVQLPGRGSRIGERPHTRMAPLVDAIVAEVPFRGPFAFFGHSLGALVAFEVARELRARGLRQPERLFVSACAAPHRFRSGEPVHELPDAQLAALINAEYGSLPGEVLDDPDLLAIVLPPHRADFEVAETYDHEPQPSLECPLTVLGGSDDEIEVGDLAAWGEHSLAPTEVQMLPGDHFYLREHRDAVLTHVRHRLQARTAGARTYPVGPLRS